MTRRRSRKGTRSITATLLGVLAACTGGGGDQPPSVENAAFTADPRPYDPALEADAALDKALSRARAENKLVLVNLGGNWCPDCHVLSGMMKIDEMNAFIERHYVAVNVDVGRPVDARYRKNMTVAQRFGLDNLSGVPTLLVVTPRGEVLNLDEPTIFANARERNPQDLADYLHRYAEMPRR